MAFVNKGKVRILRGHLESGDENDIVGNTPLWDGQPFYDKNSGKLFVGNGDGTKIKDTAPINAGKADNVDITNNDDGDNANVKFQVGQGEPYDKTINNVKNVTNTIKDINITDIFEAGSTSGTISSTVKRAKYADTPNIDDNSERIATTQYIHNLLDFKEGLIKSGTSEVGGIYYQRVANKRIIWGYVKCGITMYINNDTAYTDPAELNIDWTEDPNIWDEDKNIKITDNPTQQDQNNYLVGGCYFIRGNRSNQGVLFSNISKLYSLELKYTKSNNKYVIGWNKTTGEASTIFPVEIPIDLTFCIDEQIIEPSTNDYSYGGGTYHGGR